MARMRRKRIEFGRRAVGTKIKRGIPLSFTGGTTIPSTIAS